MSHLRHPLLALPGAVVCSAATLLLLRLLVAG